jgi:hypothetical protein
LIALGTPLCLAVLLAGTLAGCASGPNQVTSAAIVGPAGIPLSTVQDRIGQLLGQTELVERTLASGGQPSDISRDVVSGSVVYALAVEAAKRAGITIDPAQVDAALAAEAQLGGSRPETAEGARERAFAELVMAELARRELDRLVVRLDATVVDSEAEAERLARLAARRDPAADEEFEASGSRGVQARAAEVAAADPLAATAVWFGTPGGRVLYFQPNPGRGAWVVVRVNERQLTTPATGPVAPAPSVAARLDPASLQLIGLRLLQPLAEELGVQVNPRFGVWDPLAMRVVREAEATGKILVVNDAG